MPVYLFTYHAYRSWRPDHPRGFVQRDKGIQAPNPALARAYDAAAAQPPVLFDEPQQRILIWISHDACERRNWRLHFAATEQTHVHYLISWPDQQSWQAVSNRLKNVASLMLGRKTNSPGRDWFVRHGSRKRVRDRQHFDYLINTYLPRHRGLCWRDGDPAPEEPSAPADG